jgi:hypothetical protein
MLARGTVFTDAAIATVPPRMAVTVADASDSPSANWAALETSAIERSPDERSTRTPPAGAGALSWTSKGTCSPAAISSDGGRMTLIPVRTVRDSVAGAPALPKISTATADRRSTEPSAAPGGT